MGILTNAVRGMIAKLPGGKVAVTAGNLNPRMTGAIAPTVGFSAPVARTGAPGLSSVQAGATSSHGHPNH